MADRVTEDLKQIENLLSSMQNKIQETRQSLEGAPRGLAVWVADAERLVSMQREYNALLIEQQRLQEAIKQSAVKPNLAGGHANQAGYGEKPKEPGVIVNPKTGLALDEEMTNSANRLLYKQSEEKRAKLAQQQVKDAEKAGINEAKATAQTEANLKVYMDEQLKQLEAEQQATKAMQKRAAEEEHISAARAKIVNDPRYAEAIQQAGKLGLTANDLQSIEDRGGGVQRLKFAARQGGVNNQFNSYVDPTGKSTPGLSSQFRTAGSDILRDIGQFTKWSIAVAAVYTPMQKLGELVTIMIDNESKLADATIAANISFEKSGEVFDRVATSANAAGESINTTIDAYTQAVRAAGRYTSEEEKLQKASKLLSDSLILSKLSALDQSTAIDTLSAALIQSGRELDQGSLLLNKWVKVSQVANVGMDALATGVAVLGDSAETSGLDIDHLNALIAVLSEQSISGSKEAANTAKALIGSYQSDKAEASLNKYGFSLRKASGEVKDFLEVYQDIARVRDQGALSDSALSEIASGLGGGGTRRTKDVTAYINALRGGDLSRYNQIVKASQGVTEGSTLAQDSLAKKLETVQTASTRLANSWQSLAETLGDKGGLLDGFKTMINLLTGITTGTDNLFGLLGRSGPILTAFTGGLAAISSLSGSRRATLIQALGGAGIGGVSPINDLAGLNKNGLGGFTGNIAADILQMNKRGGAIVGGAAVISSGLSNLQAGRNENAIANVVGGLIGAAIGGSLSGGIGIAAGAAIGSSVADAAVTGIMKHSNDLKDFFAGVITPPKSSDNTNTNGTPTKELTTEELISQAYKSIGGGNEFFGNVRAFLEYRNSKGTPGGILDENKVGSYKNKESAALDILKKENPQLYGQLLAKQQFSQAQTAPVPTSSTYVQLQGLAEQERARQLQRVSTGEITSGQFGKISSNLAGYASRTIRDVQAFGKAFQDVSHDVNSTSDAYQAFLKLSTEGTTDQIDQINSYVSDIEKLQAQWDNWTPGTKVLDLSTGTQAFDTKSQLGDYLKSVQQQAAQFTTGALTDINLRQLKLPGIVGSATEATSVDDTAKIKDQAKKLQQQFYSDMKLTNDEIQYLTKNLDNFSVLVGNAADHHFQTITGIDQKFWDAAQKMLADQGQLAQQNGIGFQKFDVPMSTLQQLATQSLSIGQNWQQKYNYDFKPEDQIAIDNQGIVQPMHADFKILALLLEKLNEKAQKQLDGQYNIPEGATFWVPLTAAYYRNKDNGSGLNGLQGLDLTDNTNATANNTNALNSLTEAMMNRKSEEAGYGTPATFQAHSLTTLNRKSEEAGYGIPATIKPSVKTLDRKSEEAGYGIPSPQSVNNTGQSSVLSSLGTFFQQLLNELKQGVQWGSQYRPAGLGAASGGVANTSGIAGKPSPTAAPVSPSTKLDLKVSSNINLMVDGRVLASVMQNYLANELLRTDQTQGTVTKRYII